MQDKCVGQMSASAPTLPTYSLVFQQLDNIGEGLHIPRGFACSLPSSSRIGGCVRRVTEADFVKVDKGAAIVVGCVQAAKRKSADVITCELPVLQHRLG